MPSTLAQRIPWADLKAYAANGAVEILLSIAGFASGILIARGLGPEGRGQFAAAMLWPVTIGTLIGLGQQHAVGYASGAKWASPRQLRRYGLRFVVMAGLPAAAVYAAAMPWVLRKQFTAFSPALWCFVLVIPISLYGGFLHPILQGEGAFRQWNTGKVLRGAGWTAAVSLLAVVGWLTVDTLLFAQVATLGIFCCYLHAQVNRGLEGSLPQGVAPKIFKYGLAVYASGLTYMVNLQLDQILLTQWVGAEPLGLYAAAASLSNALLIVPSAIGSISFSRMARATAGQALQKGITRQTLGLTLALLVPCVVLLAVAGPFLVKLLYGDSFALSGRLLWVLAPAVLFLGMGQILADLLRGAGRPMLASLGAIAGAVVTALGLLVALPRWGVWGAAWVSCAAYALMMGVQGVLLARLLREKAANGL